MAETLSEIVEDIDRRLILQDERREWMLGITREIGRLSAAVIMASHRQTPVEVLEREFEVIYRKLLELSQGLAENPGLLYSGAVVNAQSEAAEAAVVLALLGLVGGRKSSRDDGTHADGKKSKENGKNTTDDWKSRDSRRGAEGEEGIEGSIPAPGDIGVDDRAYLNGLGDAIGELRRFVLEALRYGDVERAGHYYHWMEEIFAALNSLHYTRVSSELRKKVDVGRLLMERSLGDIVSIRQMKGLQRRLQSVLQTNETRGGTDR